MPTIRYPKPPDSLLDNRWWKALGFLGPGIIIASISIGNGETVFASRGGAIFGYSILWCFAVGVLLKFVQVYASARYMMLSGEHPMQSWLTLPGPRGWFPITLLVTTVICLPFLLAALALSTGSIVAWMIGYGGDAEKSVRLWSTLLIALAATLSWRQSYKQLERTQTIVVALLLASILIAAIACQPDLGALVKGMFVPTRPEYADWIRASYPKIAAQSPWIELVTYIGIIGGGLPAYIGYFTFLREKRMGLFAEKNIYRHSTPNGFAEIDQSPENQRFGRAWLRAIKLDVSSSFLTVFIFSSAFMVLGAVILHQSHQIPDKLDLLTHQEKFLTALHPSLLVLYRIGIIAAIGGTLFATFDVWTKTTYEGLLSIRKSGADLDFNSLKRILIATTSLIGIAVIWIGYIWSPLSNPITVVRIPALLGGTLGCGIWCLGVAWIDRRNLPATLRMNATLFTALILSGVILLSFGLIGLYLRFAT